MPQGAYFDINEPGLKEAAFGSVGALAAFFTTRFFNNKDSDRKRIRELEKAVVELKIGVMNLKSGHEAMSNILDNVQGMLHKHDAKFITIEKDIREVDKYLHDAKHELAGMINTKSLKDGIVDDLYDKMTRIEKLLQRKKK